MKKIRAEKIIRKDGKEFVRLSSHHFDVLRIKEGEIVKALLPTGEFAQVLITDKDNKEGEILKIVSPIVSGVDISVVIPLLKKEKTETIVEFLSLVGVKEIIIVETERSDVRPKEEKKQKVIERLRKISEESSRISGTKPPEIMGIFPLKYLELISPKYDVKIVFWENSSRKLTPEDVIRWKGEKKKIIFVSGPEGGLSEKEIEELEKMGFYDFTIGEKILTAEMFPIYITSVFDFILWQEEEEEEKEGEEEKEKKITFENWE